MPKTKAVAKSYFPNPVIKNLINIYQPIASLNYFNYLAGWDTETYMPMLGMHGRGRALAQLASEIQEKYLDKEFRQTLENANKEKDLADPEKAVLRVLNHIVEYYSKLPVEFVREYADLTAKTSTIWAEARRNEDVAAFTPWLQKIFDMTKMKADYLRYETEPYDVIFAEYEQGLDPKLLHSYMAEIKKFLQSLDLNAANFPKSELFEKKHYNTSRMAEFNLKVLKALGYDPTRFRLDISTHPFSLFLTPDDIRLTTKYPEYDFTCSLLPSVHEYGHGLYSSQVDSEIAISPLWPETSYALHESQSRFWENILARSSGFIKTFLPDIKDVHLGISDTDFTLEDTWRYINRVQPSLIRTEADEITYHWHIIIRYEIERDALNGKLAVKDIPAAWDEKYENYLGIKPGKPSDGILQDIHWSFGNIGYFPTYSMGSSTSAMFREALIRDTGFDFGERLDADRIAKLNEWFRVNVHQYAGTYTLDEIWEKTCGKKFSARPWIKYIKNKYNIA